MSKKQQTEVKRLRPRRREEVKILLKTLRTALFDNSAYFHWLPFLYLNPSRTDPDHRHAGGAIGGKEVGYIVRQSHTSYGDGPGIRTVRSRVLNRLASGVARGENWGTAIDSWYKVRNRAALFVAHDRLRAYENRERPWRAVKAWN